jgi:predicted RNase H-like HicB family nuclease
MSEITLIVERDEETGWFIASWDAPGGGGITTQARDLRELEPNVREAVRCHFEPGQIPRSIRLHFVSDPVLVSP